MKVSCLNTFKKPYSESIFRYYLLVCLFLFSALINASSQDYFQQEVNYKINVKLNDKTHELSGIESVEYINNSCDTLSFLYFHLWPNAYSDNNTDLGKELIARDGKAKLFDDEELRGYIDSLRFETKGNEIRWSLLPDQPDICRLFLNKPLLPGDTILLTTPFRVKIPLGVTSRLGHIGQSYQISQWYPKPAVYDKNGWHQMPYLDQGEFYSEYGNFDVSITLPSNYIVGSTGNLQNEEEKRFLEGLSADLSWLSTIDSQKSGFPPSSEKMKTLRYTEKNIHDFAWFADKRFHVLTGKVRLPDSGREVTTSVLFTDEEAIFWLEGIRYVNQAITDFSEWIGDYPYDNFTAVQSALNAGAGMEYPGITVIGLARDPYLLDEVIAHEICHSWFYSAIGSDERRFPFMDESTASAYETRYMEKRYPGKQLWEITFKNNKIARLFHFENIPVERLQELEWLTAARKNQEQPASLASPEYTYDNYAGIVYYKSGQAFNYLRAYLGDQLFDSIMHNYYSTWKNRHPQPDDLRKIFESHTDKDLTWFFDDFLGTTKRLDYKILRTENRKLLLKNKGELKGPVLLTGNPESNLLTEIWVDGFDGKKWVDLPPGNYSEIKIDPDHKSTELYRLNNNIRTSGLFRKTEPVYLRFLFAFDDPDKRSVVYVPAVDWNSADGFMAGLAFHNGTMIAKPVEYFFMPFYKFKNPGIAGYGKIGFNLIPYDNIIERATFSLEGSQFGAPGNRQYHNARIGIDLQISPEKATDPLRHSFSGYYIAASDLYNLESVQKEVIRSYIQLGYNIQRRGIINPYKLHLSLESGEGYKKTSFDFNYRFSYYGKKRGLDMRLFAGTMLNNSAGHIYSFASSGRSGSEQYLFQGVYPDRFSEFPKTLWSRQMTFNEGGLVTPVNDTLGYSRRIGSLTITSSLPGKIAIVPVKPFVNLVVSSPGSKSSSVPKLFFEAGLKAGIWDFFEIYIPLVVSHNINSVSGSFQERIRFIFTLDNLNPLKSR